ARSYYNLAEICLQLEYWDQAVEAYRQLMQIQPDFSAQVEEKLNQALHQQVKGKLEQALSYYRQAIENDPTDVESYEKALEIKPDDAELYLGLGNAFVAKGEEKKAVIAFQKAIVINPDLDRAHYQLSTMYQELDSQWHNYYEKGNKLQLEGQLEKAVIAYYQAILRNPHHSWSYHNLGDTHLKLGNWEEATIAYKKAIRLNPDYFWSNYNLGVAYSNSEQWHLAVQLYLKSIKLNPGLNLPYLTLKETLNKQWYSTIQKADILLKQGDRKSANNIYKKAIQEYQAFLPIEYFNFPKEIPTEPSILLVVDDFLPQCLRYRVHQKIEHLEAAGFSVKFIPQTEIQKAKNIIHFCHVVIFYRVPAFPEIIETIKYAKAIKKVVFYEIDDLIFDPEEYPDSFDSYAGQITHDEYEGLCRGTILFEEAMALFDYGITSTPALAQEMEKIISTKTIFIHRNALDSHNSEFLKVGIPKIKRDYISIFYGTGTKAHNSDFNELAAPAIAQILENYPQIRLTVVGYLTLPEVLLSYQDRIDQVEVIRDIRVYWDFLQQADINIAVLHSTKVNNCKSELKWFEAALLGVPSVVSATQTYLEVVEHGVDGLIAKTTEEWYENLERLVTNEQLRSSLAEAAYQKTVKNYSVPVMAKNIQQIIMTGIEQEIEKGNLVRRCSTKQKLLIVNVFYPPQSIGGGTRVVRDHVDIFMEKYRDKYEVQVFTSDNDNSVPYQITEYTYKNVHVTKVSTPMQEGMDWQYKNPEMYDIFAQYLEFNQPDLIHFHCVQRLTASVLEAAEELLSSCDDFKKQKVVEVNYVLKEKRFAKSINQAFDLIIANHVIEHIPDTISFLQEISEILSKNGFLFLAVPHKEYTFDKLRTTTSLTEIIRNYDENLNERNLYQLLDCIYFRRPINSGGDVWNGNFKHLLEKKPFKTVKDALEFAKTMINENKYTGIHCNVFTYQSFLDICNELLISNLIDLKLVSSQDVLKPYNEFFVILKKY
ncbi:MAG: tetratricopeptide repeat protein, partial [Trichodesmium sp. MAG_R04]|nr:tetratricopeptide repeat protein [Trichodesmium sp. MAG_R04]